MLDFGYYNMDCMEGMKEFPDKYFDLAIVDPPYGHGWGNGGGAKGWATKYHQSEEQKEKYFKRFAGGTWFEKYKKRAISWDIAPDEKYFEELFRVSKNQIIWGGNYFSLPPTRCFLVWRKKQIADEFTMAMAEYAWTSFDANAKVFEKTSVDRNRFHPTQKPVELYEWILGKYAHEGDKILDTHVGSASSLVACENMGFKYVGFEIDSEYYKKGLGRIEAAKSQLSLWRDMDEAQTEL